MTQITSIGEYKNIIKNRFVTLDEQGKHKIIGAIYLILTLFTVSFFGIFAIQPTLSTISSLKRQYEDNERVDQALTEKLNALRTLRAQYDEITPSLELLFAALPKSPQVPQVVRKIEKIAQEHNTTISTFNIGTTEIFPATKKSAAIYEFVFNVTVGGTSENIDAFIADIVNFDRIDTIDTINKSLKEESLQTNVVGRMYFNK